MQKPADKAVPPDRSRYWLYGGVALLTVAIVYTGILIVRARAGAAEQSAETEAAAANAPQVQFVPEEDVVGVSLGQADAPVVVREFADYQCPACSAFEPVLEKMRKDYVDTGMVRFVFFDYPLDIHKNAMMASLVARCAGTQRHFWPMHDLLYARQQEWAELPDPGREVPGLCPGWVWTPVRSLPRLRASGHHSWGCGEKRGLWRSTRHQRHAELRRERRRARRRHALRGAQQAHRAAVRPGQETCIPRQALRSAMAEYRMQGSDLYDRNRNRLGYARDNTVFDAVNRRMGYVRGNDIYDSLNRRMAFLRDADVYSSTNNRMDSMENFRKHIDKAPEGLMAVALFMLLTRPAEPE